MSRRVLRGFDWAGLQRLRRERGISRADLARLSRTGVSTIQHWESGSTSPQVDTLVRIADALGVAIGDLVNVPVDQRFPGDMRVLKGMTQPQLGVKTGVTTSTIARLERGEVPLRDDVAIPMAQALGVSVDDLYAAYQRVRDRPAGTPA